MTDAFAAGTENLGDQLHRELLEETGIHKGQVSSMLWLGESYDPLFNQGFLNVALIDVNLTRDQVRETTAANPHPDSGEHTDARFWQATPAHIRQKVDYYSSQEPTRMLHPFVLNAALLIDYLEKQ